MTARNPVEFTRQSGYGNERVGNRVQLEDGDGNIINATNPLPTTLPAAGSAVTIADGADVAQGAIADAAVTSDVAGTLSAKLRGLVAILADVWNSANNFLSAGLIGRFGSGTSDFDYVTIDGSTNAINVMQYEHHEIHGNSHYFVEDYLTLNDEAVADFVLTTDSSARIAHLVFAFEATGLMTLDFYELVTATANTGNLIVQRGNNRDKCFSGSHTAGTSATVMTDSGASFTTDALIGWKIFNVTDGSYGIITDNDTTTVTVAALVGGTDNDWDINDQYEINRSLVILRSNQTVTDVGIRMGGQSGGDANNPNRGIPGGASRNNELPLRRGTTYLFRFESGVNGNVLSYNGEWYEHTDKN